MKKALSGIKENSELPNSKVSLESQINKLHPNDIVEITLDSTQIVGFFKDYTDKVCHLSHTIRDIMSSSPKYKEEDTVELSVIHSVRKLSTDDKLYEKYYDLFLDNIIPADWYPYDDGLLFGIRL